MGYEVHNLKNGKKIYFGSKKAEIMLSEEILKRVNDEPDDELTWKEKEYVNAEIELREITAEEYLQYLEDMGNCRCRGGPLEVNDIVQHRRIKENPPLIKKEVEEINNLVDSDRGMLIALS